MLAELQRRAGGADRFAVVDTETTGVYSSDRVVEVAIVTLALDGEVIDSFDTLVNPCRDVSASHVHGITASMVADAPTFEEVAGDVAVRLHGACLVGHNVPFDERMLSGEFTRLGDDLAVPRPIDTYVTSGCRLLDACARHGIDLTGAHRASVDAWATAQLFLTLHPDCGDGAAVSAPAGLRRSGRVRRRDEVGPVQLPDAPLIAYLAARLPMDGLVVRIQEYLEVVGVAVGDLHLDRDERVELLAIAEQLGLSQVQVVQAHRRFVNDLVDAAIDDDVVTDDEYDALIRVAAALDVDQDMVEHRIASFRRSEAETRLREGMQVVLTGNHPSHSRGELETVARDLGLVPGGNVSKTTDVVFAADVESRSGKAAKARRYGIPVISVDDFLTARIGDVIAGSGSVEALKVVMCPDCHVTWTVPTTSGSRTSKQCDECSTIAPEAPTPTAPPPTVDDGEVWAPPVVEWLTCRRCASRWARPVTRGRKPHYCADCAG